MIRPSVGILLSAVVAGLACTDVCDRNPTSPECAGKPQPGWVNVNLTSPAPSSGDGGAWFRIEGGRIDSIQVVGPGLRAFWDSTVGVGEEVIIAGDLGDGIVARVWVPDVNALDAYAVVILEVAARGTWQQRDPAGYSMTVVR
jgi:hypothetical protein